jgi:hypothetical protein
MRISTKIYLSQNALHDQLVNEQTLKMLYFKREVGSHDDVLEHVVVLLKATNFVLTTNSCIKLGKFALMKHDS